MSGWLPASPAGRGNGTPPAGPAAVVLDVEGTLSPLGAVRDTLFTYTCEHLAAWLRADTPAAREVRAEAARRAGRDMTGADAAVSMLRGWLGGEEETTAPLRAARDGICLAGFRSGDLVGVFYPDVRPALTSWAAGGWSIHTYASIPAHLQHAWFDHAEGGSMAHLVDGRFDLESAGPTDAPCSYHRIARALGGRALLLSDSATEIAAADRAGWATVPVARSGASTTHHAGGVASLLDVDLDAAHRQV